MAQEMHTAPIEVTTSGTPEMNSEPIKSQSTSDVAAQDVAVDQPTSESVDCHFFKLPPELRIVIYDMVLADFQITVKGEDADHDGNAEAFEGETGERARCESYEQHGDDSMEDIDENEVEEVEDGGESGDDGEQGANGNDIQLQDGQNEEEIEKLDGDDGFEEMDQTYEDEEQQHDRNDTEQDLDDTDETEDDGSEVEAQGDDESVLEQRVQRAPLLDVCQLIRQEAAPPYIARLKALALADLAATTQSVTELKNQVDRLSGFTGWIGLFLEIALPDMRRSASQAAMITSLDVLMVIREVIELENELKDTAKLMLVMKPVQQKLSELAKIVCDFVGKDVSEVE